MRVAVPANVQRTIWSPKSSTRDHGPALTGTGGPVTPSERSVSGAPNRRWITQPITPPLPQTAVTVPSSGRCEPVFDCAVLVHGTDRDRAAKYVATE